MADDGDRVDVLTSRAKARVGAVLREKWRLDRLLGIGGMAAVYAATHRNGKRGAVKMLHPELSVDGDAKSRFLREGYAANRVEHEGAVSVLDDDVAEDGSVFLVMELLDGESVADRAEAAPGQRLPAGEVMAIADQLLAVLAAAHEKGIVHRDLKPENLFLTRDGKVKVLDFGLARLGEIAGGPRATKTGSAMGTPAFLPPEQALGEWHRVDARTDLWAVGATLFTLLSGRIVHIADSVNKLLLAAMTKPAPPLASVLPGVPREVALVVDRALAFDPKDRWQSAAEMREAVRRARAVAPGEIGPVGAGAALRDDPAGRRSVAIAHSRSVFSAGSSASPLRRAALAGAGIGVIALAAVGALLVLRAPAVPKAPGSTAPIVEAPAPTAIATTSVTVQPAPSAPEPAPSESASSAAPSARASAAVPSGKRPPAPRPSAAPSAAPAKDPFSKW